MNVSLRTSLRPYYHAAIRKPILSVLPPLLRRLPASAKFFGLPQGSIPNSKEWAQHYNSRCSGQPASYTKVDEGQKIERVPPKTVASHIHPAFSELVAQTNEAFVVAVPDGRVLGADAAVISPDNLLLEDVSVEYDCERYIPGRHSAFSQVRFPRIYPMEGNVAVLTTLSADYYSHWLLDVLPRFDLLQRAGHTPDTVDKFYLLEPKHSYQKETLTRLGIPTSKLIDSRQFPHVQADCLLVPSLTRGAFQPTQRVCRFLRKHFALGEKAAGVGPHRIYLSRAGAKHRRVLNEDKVLALLEPLGFCVVAAETLSLAEKALLFRSAEVVVFPAGSGYANILFCEPGTSVIEMFNPAFVAASTWALSNELTLNYYYVLGEPHHAKDLAPIALDIAVNIEVLAETLKLAGIHVC